MLIEGLSIIWVILINLILIPLSALILYLVTKMFKFSDTSYFSAIKVTGIIGLISVVITTIQYYTSPDISNMISIISLIFVSILLSIFLIKWFYELELGKSVLVWLVYAIINFIVISIIIGAVIASLWVSYSL